MRSYDRPLSGRENRQRGQRLDNTELTDKEIWARARERLNQDSTSAAHTAVFPKQHYRIPSATSARSNSRPLSASHSRNEGRDGSNLRGAIDNETLRDRIKSLRSGQLALKAKIQPDMRETLLGPRPNSSSTQISSDVQDARKGVNKGRTDSFGTNMKPSQLRARSARTPTFGDAGMALISASQTQYHSSWMPSRPRSSFKPDDNALIPYKPPRFQSSEASVRVTVLPNNVFLLLKSHFCAGSSLGATGARARCDRQVVGGAAPLLVVGGRSCGRRQAAGQQQRQDARQQRPHGAARCGAGGRRGEDESAVGSESIRVRVSIQVDLFESIRVVNIPWPKADSAGL
jgi:hypothetical protein